MLYSVGFRSTRLVEMGDEPELLKRLAEYFDDLQVFRMPFGRYGPDRFPPRGKMIYQLPLEYLVWFKERGGGFPTGRLGQLMEFVYEVKSTGAQEVFRVFSNHEK